MNDYLLVDADDVLFDWFNPFQNYLRKKLQQSELWGTTNWKLREYSGLDDTAYNDYVMEFNSLHIGKLPLKSEAQKVMKRLHKKGFRTVVISSCGNSPEITKGRAGQVLREFGIDVVHCLPLGHSKLGLLKEYSAKAAKPSFWVEDNYRNAIDGADAGFTSILIKPHHSYSIPIKDQDFRVKICNTWESIYTVIKEQRGQLSLF